MFEFRGLIGIFEVGGARPMRLGALGISGLVSACHTVQSRNAVSIKAVNIVLCGCGLSRTTMTLFVHRDG